MNNEETDIISLSLISTVENEFQRDTAAREEKNDRRFEEKEQSIEQMG